MVELDEQLPPEGVEVLVKFEDGRFAVASYHSEHSEKWHPGNACFGEYGYEACIQQDVIEWVKLDNF